MAVAVPWLGIAALWGFAEAALFFIVPDVLISWIAVRERRGLAFAVALAAAIGAVPGTMLMWLWGATDFATASSIVESLPAISLDMIDAMRVRLKSEPLLVVLVQASLSGVPIKVAGIVAPDAGVSPWAIGAATGPARFLRFALVATAAYWMSRLLAQWFTLDLRVRILIAFWIVLYTVFWTLAPA